MFHKLTARLEGKPIDATPASNDRGGFWRTLDEIRDAEVFRDYITERFPRFAAHLNVDRREFLKLMSASLALAGMGACSREPQGRGSFPTLMLRAGGLQASRVSSRPQRRWQIRNGCARRKQYGSSNQNRR